MAHLLRTAPLRAALTAAAAAGLFLGAARPADSATHGPRTGARAQPVLQRGPGATPTGAGGDDGTWSARGCTRAGCHDHIEPIRPRASEMFQEISEEGAAVGDPDGCVVCHGGDLAADTPTAAHRGAPKGLAERGGPDAFFADPASPWINARTCGRCHEELARAQWRSLMMTEAGKIQGTTWAFGSLEGRVHRWGNHDVANPEDAARLGTADYQAYMARKAAAHPDIFVPAHRALPPGPDALDLSHLDEEPALAAFTYIRNQCNRCHLGVKGRSARGDYRGMGCGACHLPYGNEGLYEGRDTALPRDTPGHVLVHQIQATRDTSARAGDVTWSGIPVETCTTCHNRGKRIGVSYQGLMEAAWGSPYTEGGGGQIGLHTKHYIHLSEDVHARKGMLCQDCHTSGDVHGDGYLAGANLAAVEIECSDCHGTPDRYPWELPLGWGDEDGPGPATGPARGVADTVPEHLRRGAVADPADGYLRTARGNPMPEVVRVGDRVRLHTAGGKDLWLDPLKRKAERDELSVEARVAMQSVHGHVDNMECYACHSSWAPQCYGCHVKVDYSDGARSFDWVAASNLHRDPAHRADADERGYATTVAGVVTELRSYMRWEDPPLGNNGEGRVSPLIPGCQVSATVIGPDGEDVVRNHIFRTSPHSEGAGAEGQLGSDMSPVAPHTVGRARTCESCHGSAKALGYGISEPTEDGDGSVRGWDAPTVVDLQTADGAVIPSSARPQIEAIAGLVRDWSAVVTPGGRQLQTVGSHFEGSGPLRPEQRARVDRRNVCLGCHAKIPAGSVPISLLHHVAEQQGLLPHSNAQHRDLLGKIVSVASWAQLLAVPLAAGGLIILVLVWRRRRRA